MFFKKKTRKVFSAIKLYSIGDDQNAIQREELVDSILAVFENIFKEFPEDYDINGPYKIKKGTTVKLNTFKKRLHDFGHDKYYAYYGHTEGRLGFDVNLSAKTNNTLTYTELIIWYDSHLWDIHFREIVSMLMKPLSLSCGYLIDIDEGYYIPTESKINKSFSGVTSIKVSFGHKQWINHFQHGEVRALFKENIWTEKQLHNALSQHLQVKYESIGDRYYVKANNE